MFWLASSSRISNVETLLGTKSVTPSCCRSPCTKQSSSLTPGLSETVCSLQVKEKFSWKVYTLGEHAHISTPIIWLVAAGIVENRIIANSKDPSVKCQDGGCLSHGLSTCPIISMVLLMTEQLLGVEDVGYPALALVDGKLAKESHRLV